MMDRESPECANSRMRGFRLRPGIPLDIFLATAKLLHIPCHTRDDWSYIVIEDAVQPQVLRLAHKAGEIRAEVSLGQGDVWAFHYKQLGTLLRTVLLPVPTAEALIAYIQDHLQQFHFFAWNYASLVQILQGLPFAEASRVVPYPALQRIHGDALKAWDIPWLTAFSDLVAVIGLGIQTAGGREFPEHELLERVARLQQQGITPDWMRANPEDRAFLYHLARRLGADLLGVDSDAALGLSFHDAEKVYRLTYKKTYFEYIITTQRKVNEAPRDLERGRLAIRSTMEMTERDILQILRKHGWHTTHFSQLRKLISDAAVIYSYSNPCLETTFQQAILTNDWTFIEDIYRILCDLKAKTDDIFIGLKKSFGPVRS